MILFQQLELNGCDRQNFMVRYQGKKVNFQTISDH